MQMAPTQSDGRHADAIHNTTAQIAWKLGRESDKSVYLPAATAPRPPDRLPLCTTPSRRRKRRVQLKARPTPAKGRGPGTTIVSPAWGGVSRGEMRALWACSKLTGGKTAARMADSTAHGGTIAVGFPSVMIGG